MPQCGALFEPRRRGTGRTGPVSGQLHRLLVVSGLRVGGEAGTAAGGLVLVRSRPADVLVISPCAGDMAGTIRYARREAGIGVVLFVTRVDDAFVVDMMVG